KRLLMSEMSARGRRGDSSSILVFIPTPTEDRRNVMKIYRADWKSAADERNVASLRFPCRILFFQLVQLGSVIVVNQSIHCKLIKHSRSNICVNQVFKAVRRKLAKFSLPLGQLNIGPQGDKLQ